MEVVLGGVRDSLTTMSKLQPYIYEDLLHKLISNTSID